MNGFVERNEQTSKQNKKRERERNEKEEMSRENDMYTDGRKESTAVLRFIRGHAIEHPRKRRRCERTLNRGSQSAAPLVLGRFLNARYRDAPLSPKRTARAGNLGVGSNVVNRIYSTSSLVRSYERPRSLCYNYDSKASSSYVPR